MKWIMGGYSALVLRVYRIERMKHTGQGQRAHACRVGGRVKQIEHRVRQVYHGIFREEG